MQNIFKVHFMDPLDQAWLMDDVMTSGGSINEIARVLKKICVTFAGSLTLTRRLLDS